jgi:23S rRNA (adenine2503-C2)-methyltransferase
MEKQALFGKTMTELENIASEKGFPKYVAKQIADWLYKKNISSIDEMSNLSKKIRDELNLKFELGLDKNINVQSSTDGTKKYLYNVGKSRFIEAAYIPEEKRATLCVSTQSGCKMACEFCMTGKQGFQGHLTSGQILNQVKMLPEFEKLTNIVYMGMGEPLDNVDEVLKSIEILTSDYGFGMSPKRITVSTTGIIPGLIRFLDESNCHLAISIHNPIKEERLKIMPVEKKNPIEEVLSIIKNHDFSKQRRVSFEYIMFKDFNDTPVHAKELVKQLHGLKSRVNLIRFHSIPGATLVGSSDSKIEEFKELLEKKGLTVTIRKSRGQDIDAACGMLSTKEMNK